VPTALVDVVLPCLDEARALPSVLAGLPAGYRAVVVDNGSTDGSAAVARSFGATVVDEPRRGFGSACLAGLAATTADVVAFCDADGSLDLRHLPRVVSPVVDGAADLVLGRRVPTRWHAWPLHARVANRVLAREMSALAGVRLRDLGPMRAARRTALLGLGLDDVRSGFPLQTVALAARAGWRIAEVAVPYRPRIGRSKVTGTVRGTWEAIHDMRAVLRA
jgi:glycosyltransferase involved in cell wall biosynthesis